MSTKPATWRTITTTQGNGVTTVARKLDNGPPGIGVTLWRSTINGAPHDSVMVLVEPCTEPCATDMNMHAADACRQLAARLLEAADSIALGATNPGGGTAARDDDHALRRDPLATATPPALWCPDCGPETGTHSECDVCGDAATNNEKE